MVGFLLGRLPQAIGVMIVVALLAFVLFRFAGDPLTFLLGQEATAEEREIVREQLGLKASEAPKPVLLAGMTLPPTEVSNIVTGRCAMCHAPEPSWPGIQIAPKGVMLHEPEQIAMHARAIRAQAVMTHAMPPNNLSGMTPAERKALAGWLAAAR